MAHPLVTQLHFTRSEFVRVLTGVSPEDALYRVEPMNSISWIVGHLANQEQRYWLQRAQGRLLYPELNDQVGTGKPGSTPPIEKMWAAWREITLAADPYLDTLTPQTIETYFEWQGKPAAENIGTMLLRNIYHYWYHLGEACAILQTLGRQNIPEIVGSMVVWQFKMEE